MHPIDLLRPTNKLTRRRWQRLVRSYIDPEVHGWLSDQAEPYLAFIRAVTPWEEWNTWFSFDLEQIAEAAPDYSPRIQRIAISELSNKGEIGHVRIAEHCSPDMHFIKPDGPKREPIGYWQAVLRGTKKVMACHGEDLVPLLW